MSQNVEKPKKINYNFETATRSSRGTVKIGPWECEDRDLTRAQRRKILNAYVPVPVEGQHSQTISDEQWAQILADHLNEIALEPPSSRITADLVDATLTEVEFWATLKRLFPSILI